MLPQRFPLHSAILESLEEGLIRQEFSPDTLKNVTVKVIYQGRIEDIIPQPKVETEFPGVDFCDIVYPRLCHKVLEPAPRDLVFSVAHGIFRNRAKLFRQRRAADPYCPVLECQGKVQDREHIFCSCTLVVEAWLWVRRQLLLLLPHTVGAVGVSNEEFIMMQFPKDNFETEIVWLLGNYLHVAEAVAIGKGKKLRPDHLKGVLRNRLLVMKNRAVIRPNLVL